MSLSMPQIVRLIRIRSWAGILTSSLHASTWRRLICRGPGRACSLVEFVNAKICAGFDPACKPATKGLSDAARRGSLVRSAASMASLGGAGAVPDIPFVSIPAGQSRLASFRIHSELGRGTSGAGGERGRGKGAGRMREGKKESVQERRGERGGMSRMRIHTTHPPSLSLTPPTPTPPYRCRQLQHRVPG